MPPGLTSSGSNEAQNGQQDSKLVMTGQKCAINNQKAGNSTHSVLLVDDRSHSKQQSGNMSQQHLRTVLVH